jgi:hypothetical protein
MLILSVFTEDVQDPAEILNTTRAGVVTMNCTASADKEETGSEVHIFRFHHPLN